MFPTLLAHADLMHEVDDVAVISLVHFKECF